MNNQSCTVRPTLIDLNPDKLLYYPFIVNLDRCDGSCNTVEDLLGTICVPNKIQDINLKVFNMSKGTNEPRRVIKHTSSKCIREFDSRKCNSKQNWNSDKCQLKLKKQ